MNRFVKSTPLRFYKTIINTEPSIRPLSQLWPKTKPLTTITQNAVSSRNFSLFSDVDVSELFSVPPLKPSINRFYSKKPKKSNKCNPPIKCRIVSKTDDKITVDCSPIDPNVKKEEQRLAEEKRKALLEAEKKALEEAAKIALEEAAKKALEEAEKLKLKESCEAAEKKETCPPEKVDDCKEPKMKPPKRLQGCQVEEEEPCAKKVDICQEKCPKKNEIGENQCVKEKEKKEGNCEKENFNV